MSAEITYTEEKIYDRCLTIHAHKWMRDYQDLSSVEYLELMGGSLMAHFFTKYGAHTVLGDLDRKIAHLIQ
jgi:hypothetical protein